MLLGTHSCSGGFFEMMLQYFSASVKALYLPLFIIPSTCLSLSVAQPIRQAPFSESGKFMALWVSASKSPQRGVPLYRST